MNFLSPRPLIAIHHAAALRSPIVEISVNFQLLFDD